MIHQRATHVVSEGLDYDEAAVLKQLDVFVILVEAWFVGRWSVVELGDTFTQHKYHNKHQSTHPRTHVRTLGRLGQGVAVLPEELRAGLPELLLQGLLLHRLSQRGGVLGDACRGVNWDVAYTQTKGTGQTDETHTPHHPHRYAPARSAVSVLPSPCSRPATSVVWPKGWRRSV